MCSRDFSNPRGNIEPTYNAGLYLIIAIALFCTSYIPTKTEIGIAEIYKLE